MPRVVCVIQARLGSTRLPGKVLMDIGGKPMLQRVVDRVRECDMVDNVVVTYPAADKALQHFANDQADTSGWAYLGDPDDVLDRYASAAEEWQAGIIVRITADCPLVDPAIIDDLVRVWLQGGYWYVAMDNDAMPRGCAAEVFGARVLRQANAATTTAYDREHVTPWIQRRGDCVRLPNDPDTPEHPGRWCVDEQADLDFVRAVYEHLDDPLAGWREVLAVVEEHGLASINAGVKQKAT